MSPSSDENDPGADFVLQKLIVRWQLDGDDFPSDDEEDAAQAFAAALDPVLAASGRAEVNGFEFETGLIDILIFGRDTEDDLDELCAIVEEVFLSHPCPAGSALIKTLGDPRREVICALIPPADG